MSDANKALTKQVLEEVDLERADQDTKWGEQNHHHGIHPSSADVSAANLARNECEIAFKTGNPTWRAILWEEVAELFAAGNDSEIETEAIQVAAVCCAMVESMRRNRKTEEGSGP